MLVWTAWISSRSAQALCNFLSHFSSWVAARVRFLTLSFFVLTHIGDRHVFYLLLMRFCTFSMQTQPHYCVLEKSLFPAIFARGIVVCCLVSWCLHCVFCSVAHESCTLGGAEISGDSKLAMKLAVGAKISGECRRAVIRSWFL